MREVRIPGIRRVLRISWTGEGIARDVDDEIGFHIDARTDELMRLGMSARDARERAESEYGDVPSSRRDLLAVDRRRLGHESREEVLMSFVDDLGFALRSLLRRPSLLIVTTLTLSIGIAANAIMFGVVDQLLLRPPPHITAPGRVKRVYYRDIAQGTENTNPVTTYPTVTALRQQAAFSDVAVFGWPSEWSLGAGATARGVRTQLVSGNYFRLLGASPQLGRWFTDTEDRIPVGERVAIVSEGFWRAELAARRDALGRVIILQGKPFTVIGVAPAGFTGVDREQVDAWVPVSSVANETMGPGWHNTAHNWWARIVVRLRDSVGTGAATAQSTTVYRRLVAEWNEPTIRDSTSSIVFGSVVGTRTPGGVSAESKVSLWLMGVSIIVLLIACANVANLLLARTTERQREIAVRIALGVSRARLFQLLLAEAAVLAAFGAVTALVVALGVSRVVQRTLLPNIVWNDSILDRRMLAFTMAVTVLCVLLAGLAPVLHGVATRVSEGLKSSARQVTSSRGRLRFSLLALQAALSVILLVGAGLFVRSLRNVVTRDIGIDAQRVFKIEMPLRRYGFDSLQIEDIYRRGAERLGLLPGVTNVAVGRLTVPMSSASARDFSVPGVPRLNLPGGGPYNAVVTPGFFATVGSSIVAGRDFTPAEARAPSRVAIVNEIIAKAYWPNASPIGKCVKLGEDSSCSVVVGVAKNVVQFGVVNDDRAIAYAPPLHPGFPGARPSAMLVRVAGGGESMAPMIRRELQALAPNMPFVQVRTYEELIASQLQPRRLAATMFTLFGVIALLIAAIGLYSVMAYWVSQRTHEIGVRMALGAQRGDVLRMVAAQSSRAVLAGLVLGGVTAIIASRWVTDLLYETSPRDPLVYAGAAVVLGLAGLLASVVPARRSTAVEPAQAMRAE